MKRATAIALLLVGHAAGAQPVIHPEPCRVTVATAPPDVRAEIEAWVAAEPRCVRELEVRVVPTEGGLYLSATDPNGHVRDRVVPDAQSAAVLVVSWMADDSLGPMPPSPAVDDVGPTHVERAAPEIDEESPFSLGGHTRFHQTQQRYLTIGAIGHEVERGRIRVQLDLWSAHGVSFGVAAGGGDDVVQGRVIVGATKAFGRFSVRAQLGFGADLRHDDHDYMQPSGTLLMSSPDRNNDGLTPHAELGLLGRIAIDPTWAVLGGPVLDVSPDHAVVEGFVGVQHSL